MSLFETSAALSITYYREKCEQHLRRTMASYDLSVEALKSVDLAPFLTRHPALFDNDDPTPQKRARMQTVLIKSHFLLLKVELELFLHLLALENWRTALSDERMGKKTLAPAARKVLKKLTPPDAEALLAHTDVVEALCAAIVPRQGLDKIAEAMKPVGTDLKKLCYARGPRVWPQIKTAFEVRHLIEHRNGLIDRSFRERSSAPENWTSSNWGKRLGELTERQKKVTVTETDLRETADAMLEALIALDESCRELVARRDAPPAPRESSTRSAPCVAFSPRSQGRTRGCGPGYSSMLLRRVYNVADVACFAACFAAS
jgi:hypothetical protein